VKKEIIIDNPTSSNGYAVHRLISQCPPLDENSIYANLLQCTHFSSTSALAHVDGRIVGFVSGYILPGNPQCIFIWQVAVAEEARGKGLAKNMVSYILNNESCKSVTHLHTTITKENLPSRALFRKISIELNTEMKETPLFNREIHFLDEKDSEFLIDIGPFQSHQADQGVKN
jgi:L-2,4-diaminobutyric acid acetyltransferase